MTDADVDRDHQNPSSDILQTHAEIINRGYLYIALPPLYKIQTGKDVVYAYNDEEK